MIMSLSKRLDVIALGHCRATRVSPDRKRGRAWEGCQSRVSRARPHSAPSRRSIGANSSGASSPPMTRSRHLEQSTCPGQRPGQPAICVRHAKRRTRRWMCHLPPRRRGFGSMLSRDPLVMRTTTGRESRLGCLRWSQQHSGPLVSGKSAFVSEGDWTMDPVLPWPGAPSCEQWHGGIPGDWRAGD
jgi:hypothetical protein